MADKVQRWEPVLYEGFAVRVDMEHCADGNWVKLNDIAALHADIIEQGRKVQIAASGESKYGAMGAGEYIEWVAKMLEGR